MFYQILHNKTAQALGGWVGLLSVPLTVLSKLTPEWFGDLTWPQAILAGLCGALGGTLIVALILAIFAYAYRLIRPATFNGEALRPPATADSASPSSPAQLVEAYDDTQLRRSMADVNQAVQSLRGDLKRLDEKIDKSAEEQDQARAKAMDEVLRVRDAVVTVANPLVAQAQRHYLSLIKPLTLAEPPLRQDVAAGTNTYHAMRVAEGIGQQWENFRGTLIEMGFDLKELEQEIAQRMDRLRANPEFLSVGPNEVHHWDSLSDKQQWLAWKVRADAANEWLNAVKVESPFLRPRAIAALLKF